MGGRCEALATRALDQGVRSTGRVFEKLLRDLPIVGLTSAARLPTPARGLLVAHDHTDELGCARLSKAGLARVVS